MEPLKPPMKGFKRAYVVCQCHGRAYYYDYLPYSLSNPIMTAPCGCNPRLMKQTDADTFLEFQRQE